MQHIDSNALQARRLEGWITAAVCLAILAVLGGLTVRFAWPWWIFIVFASVGILYSVLEVAVIPGIYYRAWRYRITEKEIELHHGILVRKRTLIPMSRIQHVDSKQGPILKQYGLSTVAFATAAGSHSIPALSEAAAEQVRHQISDLAGVADEDI